MDVFGLMEKFKSLNNFRQDLNSFIEGENFVLLLGLVIEKISTITIFADHVLELVVLFEGQ